MGQTTSNTQKRELIRIADSSAGSTELPSIIEVQGQGISIFVGQDYEESLRHCTDQYRIDHNFREQHPTHYMRLIIWPLIEFLKFDGQVVIMNLQGNGRIKIIFENAEDSNGFKGQLGLLKKLDIQAGQESITSSFTLLKKAMPIYLINPNFLDLNKNAYVDHDSIQNWLRQRVCEDMACCVQDNVAQMCGFIEKFGVSKEFTDISDLVNSFNELLQDNNLEFDKNGKLVQRTHTREQFSPFVLRPRV